MDLKIGSTYTYNPTIEEIGITYNPVQTFPFGDEEYTLKLEGKVTLEYISPDGFVNVSKTDRVLDKSGKKTRKFTAFFDWIYPEQLTLNARNK